MRGLIFAGIISIVMVRAAGVLPYSAQAAGERRNAMAVAITSDQGTTWVFKYVEIEVPQIFYADGTDGVHFVYQGPAFGHPAEPILDSFTVPIGETWHMYTLGRTAEALPHGVSTDGRKFTWFGFARFSIERQSYIATNEIFLEDGRVRVFALRPGPGGDIRSFVTSDGYRWEAEDGIRLALDTSSGLEKSFVKDAAVVQLVDGTYFMVYVTVIPE
jgi:hypothetical protein